MISWFSLYQNAKICDFLRVFSPGFFGTRESRLFAPTSGLLTLRVDKGQNLRRARHRARKGIGSTLFSPVSRPSEVLDRKVSIYACFVLAGLPPCSRRSPDRARFLTARSPSLFSPVSPCSRRSPDRARFLTARSLFSPVFDISVGVTPCGYLPAYVHGRRI